MGVGLGHSGSCSDGSESEVILLAGGWVGDDCWMLVFPSSLVHLWKLKEVSHSSMSLPVSGCPEGWEAASSNQHLPLRLRGLVRDHTGIGGESPGGGCYFFWHFCLFISVPG